MATFIAYQPRANKPSFTKSRKSSTVGLSSWLSSRHGSESPQQDFSDLPSLTDVFTRNDTRHGGSVDLSSNASAPPTPADRIGTEYCCEGNCENSGNLTATTAAGIQLGASQENSIALDDDQLVDTPDAAVSDDKNSTHEVTDPTPLSGPSLILSERTAEPGIEPGKDTPDSLAKYSTYDPTGDGKEGRSNEPHKDDALHIRTLTRGNDSNKCSDSGVGSDAPASVGQIHDIFAEFEETFGMARHRQKQKTAVTTLPNFPDRDIAAGTIAPPVSQGEPRSAADDGVAVMRQLTGAVSGDVSRNYSSNKELENGSTFQSRQENDGQETQAEQVRSQYSSILASDCYSDGASVSAGPLPSPPPMVTRETTPLNPSADTQGASNQKRPRSSTQPTILSVDGAPRKRPRRATKETWKAREARKALEGFEAKPSQTLLNPCRKKQTPFTSPDSDRGDVVSKVVNIEDVNVGEDGSIQCLVTLKPSLIEIENVVGRVLLRRCEELFGKRYGHKGVQRRAITKRHT